MDNKPALKDLFLAYLKIGVQSIGGGFAMLTIMENLLVEEKKWVTHEDYMHAVTVGQSSPGVMICNVGGFLAYRIGGFKAFILAMFGLVFPSFLVVLILAIFYTGVHENIWLQKFFKGVGPAVVGSLVGFTLRQAKRNLNKISLILIALISFGLLLFKLLHPVWVIILAGIFGIILCLYRHHRQKNG